MLKYNFHRAKSLMDLSENLLKYKENSKIIAGGTDILVQIFEKDKKFQNLQCIIDITALKDELRYIREEENKIHIGALSTHTDIENSEIIKNNLLFLSNACKSVGSLQIRNRGTIGGSICNASPAADPLTPLVASNTTVVIQGLNSERQIDLKDFYIGKGQIDLKDGEFLKEFIVDKLPLNMKNEFVKLGRRKALAISRLNVSAGLLIENGIIKEARICPGCIFTKPDRVTKAEELILGKEPSNLLFKEAGEKVSEVMIERTGVRWSTEYKKPVVEGLVERALLRIAGLEE